jgi:predicted phosphodiesterase
MQKIGWTSDIHLDRMDEQDHLEFKEWLIKLEVDALIISGDIGEADSVVGYLRDLHNTLSFPIYFILGNHDFWGSSFDEVRVTIRAVVNECPNLHWLTESGIIELNSTTALIGHECWADGRYGDFSQIETVPRDFMRIKDLTVLQRSQYEKMLNELGDEAAFYVRKVLLEAVADYKHIYLAVHVPPFKEASLDRSRRICDDKKLPFYSCKAVGDVLLEIMNNHPECELTVLSGHMHEVCDVKIMNNLNVRVLDAGYSTWYPPAIIKI